MEPLIQLGGAEYDPYCIWGKLANVEPSFPKKLYQQRI